MQKLVFVVRDDKAETFGNPFTSATIGTALRDFQRAATDPSSEISLYPSDFSLYQIATYDDFTGDLLPIPRINLGPATQFKVLQEG